MRISVAIEETYLDPMSAYGRYRRAMLWNPPLSGEEPETMLGFLASLEKAEGSHGGPFRSPPRPIPTCSASSSSASSSQR